MLHNISIGVILGGENERPISILEQKEQGNAKNVSARRVRSPKGKAWKEKKAPHPSAAIPAIPKGTTEDTYGEQKRTISVEWKKLKKDYNLLWDLMTSTLPMRRREILTKNLLRVWQIMEDFPNFGSSSGNEVWKYNTNQTVNAC